MEATTLEKALQTTKDHWEQEKEVSSSCGKKTPASYLMSKGYLWKHKHISNIVQTDQVVLCI